MKQIAINGSVLALALVSACAFAGSIEPGDHMEMAAVLNAPVTPTQAVKIAESGGGRAYGYGMEANRHGHWYEVEVLRGDSRLELRIDASSGRVLGSSAAHGEDARGAHALDGSKLTFGQAIAQAERVGHGPALEADATGHGDQAHVDVDVIQNHGKRVEHYRVSLVNGQVHVSPVGSDT